jgi:hypothetical protein
MMALVLVTCAALLAFVVILAMAGAYALRRRRRQSWTDATEREAIRRHDAMRRVSR